MGTTRRCKHYVVAGTPNRLGTIKFFVRYGDGAADMKPIAHLYKSQVYQLAAYLGVPGEIQNRVPTDTYSLEQSQRSSIFPFRLRKWTRSLRKEQRNCGFRNWPLVGLTGGK